MRTFVYIGMWDDGPDSILEDYLKEKNKVL